MLINRKLGNRINERSQSGANRLCLFATANIEEKNEDEYFHREI